MSASAPTATEEKRQIQQHHSELDHSAQTGESSSAGHPSASTSNPQNPTPPPYSGPSSPSPQDGEADSEQQQRMLQQQLEQQDSGAERRRQPQRYPGLPRLDYSLYSPATFELQPGAAAIKSTATYLSANEQALVSLVRSQATVPPKPVIEIRGSRGRHVDFHVRCNLMSLLVPEDPAGRLDYLRCVSPDEPALRGGAKPKTAPHPGGGTLEAWARAYVRDQSHSKCFVLERQVVNLDVNFIEGQIRTMVAAMGYRGLLTVSVPLLHSRVVVQSPDRVNRFLTSVTTLFTGRSTYEVAKAVWPFATHPKGEPGRRCAVQSEETWWKEWRDPLKFAIATRRSGWVTNEDKLECIMESKGKGVAVDWGPDSLE
ncbi:hypothetical protein RB597_006214 [Gaeumannomyces tritici]